MIKEKDLHEIRPQVRIPNGGDIDFQTLSAAFSNQASAYGVDLAFYMDEIKYGGMLSSNSEQCLVAYHPLHIKDYFKFAFTIKHQGTYVFISVYQFGESIQIGNNYFHDNFKHGLKNAWNSDAGALNATAYLLGAGVGRITRGKADKRKLEEEQNWYTIMSDVFDAVIS